VRGGSARIRIIHDPGWQSSGSVYAERAAIANVAQTALGGIIA